MKKRKPITTKWQEWKGDYYLWDSNGDLPAGLYKDWNGEDEPTFYRVQIHPVDLDLMAIVIGRISIAEFIPLEAQALCELALKQKQTLRWWRTNKDSWFQDNFISKGAQ